MASDHYTHVLTIPEDKVLIAVTCSTCRTAVFYRSSTGATNAVMHHRRACSLPLVKVTPIMDTREMERVSRAPAE